MPRSVIFGAMEAKVKNVVKDIRLDNVVANTLHHGAHYQLNQYRDLELRKAPKAAMNKADQKAEIFEMKGLID